MTTQFVLVDDTNSEISYDQNWVAKGIKNSTWTSNGFPLNYTTHENVNSTAQFNYTFTGTTIQVYSAISAQGAQPFWNFSLLQESTLKNSSQALQGTSDTNQFLIYEADSLPYAKYTLVATASGISNLSQPAILDYILFAPVPVDGGPQSAALKILKNDPSIQYDKGWDLGTPSAVATTADLSMRLKFTGTSITWIGSYHQNYTNSGAAAVYSVDSSLDVPFYFPSGVSAINNSMQEQQNQVYFKVPTGQIGSHNITVRYEGNISTTPLILDYLIVENPWVSPPKGCSLWKCNALFHRTVSVLSVLGAVLVVVIAALIWRTRCLGRKKSAYKKEAKDKDSPTTVNINNIAASPRQSEFSTIQSVHINVPK
ncbi:hypothetical protein GALMADRAFT_151357 [Galerina marginata CBS 339.88]|uniref:Uncharacterized protein n=1 Tax=Galerina marginata (strain CBS 339.88) TaxID=685588 RepID=A0A067TMW2_GALM3|nr:hypothetical protein GALMADRAFT_151357 [Galerina marginata CBS 339.88]